MRPRVLVAAVGNAALHDDGFGVEVLQRLETSVLPSWVQIADFGIGCGHLDHALVGGYDTTILIDATARGGSPGDLHVLAADLDENTAALPTLLDPHGIRPEGALRLLRMLGGDAGRVFVVGCEPARTTEGIGLSPAVATAVNEAVRIVTDLIWGDEPSRPVEQAVAAGSSQPEAPWQLEAVPGE